jgi:hypothetical protein
MNTINRLALAMQLDETQQGDDVDLLAWQRIVIDGVEIDPDHAVDLVALGRSLFVPGEHDIFTCGCGSPACAYIVEGVRVIHEPGLIRWQMRRPVSYRDFEGNEFCEQIEVWRQRAPYVEYLFRRDQMVREFEDGMAWLRNETPRETDYSPYGFHRSDLERIDLEQGSQCLWWRDPGKKLYVLCDQDDWFLFEGRFLTSQDLALSAEYCRQLEEFRGGSCHEQRTNPLTRLHWLEEVQNLLLDAYSHGLSDDMEICLLAQYWGKDGCLDAWRLESRMLHRNWLDTTSKYDWEYLIVTTLENFMYVWFDRTFEPKEGWPERVNTGTQFCGPFRVPLELEREFILWASRVPDSEEIPDWAWRFHWQAKPEAAKSTKYSTWSEFHEQGVALARQLAQLLSGRVTVMYERPGEDESDQAPRRQLIHLVEDGQNENSDGGSSHELAG